MKGRQKRYPKALKIKVVKLHKEEGWTFNDITEEFGPSKATITLWCKELYGEILRERTEKDNQEELDKLKLENEELKKENGFLRKAALYFAKESL